MDMTFKFECPHCGQHISAAAEDAGIQACCPNCCDTFTVPNVSDATPPAVKPPPAPPADEKPLPPRSAPGLPLPLPPVKSVAPPSVPITAPMSYVDRQFENIGCGMIGATVFFPAIVLVVSLFGIGLCRNPEMKRRAMVLAAVSFFWFAVNVGLFLFVIDPASRR